eukprot:CAMPEP_0183335776 /NCGR_PEP_ID=MMETSP0164_2-20130417/3970_1 /TAXON_ID=221442 /ORGANISM="Coccolithus pelagicus ssp braarudi, Strain PLY182g" /LENGTH=57 /DNA_ID=CAMNT_0025505189 /DNA_START=137 /DNA_END=310 /DNA_ORIENTATION=-
MLEERVALHLCHREAALLERVDDDAGLGGCSRLRVGWDAAHRERKVTRDADVLGDFG